MSQHSLQEFILSKQEELGGFEEDEDEERQMGHVMSIVWAGGKIGLALYNLETTEILYLQDTPEKAPDFSVLRLIYEQIHPRIILVCIKQEEKLVNVLREITGNTLVETTVEDDQVTPGVSRNSRMGNLEPSSSIQVNSVNTNSVQSQLRFLSIKDFAPDPGRARVLEIRIPREPKNNTPENHKLFIADLIPLNERIMMRALGALVRFMDRTVEDFLKISLRIDQTLPILDVKPITMEKLVYVENSAWLALNIFSPNLPIYMKGEVGRLQQDRSLFSFLNKTMTFQGAKKLRMMLLQPTRDLSLIKRRHEVMEFVRKPVNGILLQDIIDRMKGIKNFSRLLAKISIVRATVQQWKALYTSLTNALLLGRLCSKSSTIDIFQEISTIASGSVFNTIIHELTRIIDFESSLIKKHLTARAGISEELDSKKADIAQLPEIMDIVATEELNKLPTWVKNTYVASGTEFGYLVSLEFEEIGVPEDSKVNLGDLTYQFKEGQRYFYKSPRTREMDITFGDIQLEILHVEIDIIVQLSDFIMKYSDILLKFGELIAELDALIAMGITAVDNNFIRPNFIESNGTLMIRNGRHPLVQSLRTFTPNSTDFAEKIIVLTGPNASGKSIYLKQVGLIVLLALTGNYVPADAANIPTFDRICTRIHATESISTGMSTFQIDLIQMSHALKMGTGSSLILMDEFGKGTDNISGISLLGAFLKDFQNRGTECPTVFCSTHFHELVAIVQPCESVCYQTMDFEEVDRSLVFLYKLKRGVCTFSYANFIARRSGIPETIIERTNLFDDYLNDRMCDLSNLHLTTEEWEKKKKIYVELGEKFNDLDIEDQPPAVVAERFLNYIDSLKQRLREEGYMPEERTETQTVGNLHSSREITNASSDEESASQYSHHFRHDQGSSNKPIQYEDSSSNVNLPLHSSENFYFTQYQPSYSVSSLRLQKDSNFSTPDSNSNSAIPSNSLDLGDPDLFSDSTSSDATLRSVENEMFEFDFDSDDEFFS